MHSDVKYAAEQQHRLQTGLVSIEQKVVGELFMQHNLLSLLYIGGSSLLAACAALPLLVSGVRAWFQYSSADNTISLLQAG